MMNVYRDMLPEMGGYLTDKSKIHLPRLELFIQEISRREPLYFQQRAIDERDQGYADDGYKAHYYKVCILYYDTVLHCVTLCYILLVVLSNAVYMRIILYLCSCVSTYVCE